MTKQTIVITTSNFGAGFEVTVPNQLGDGDALYFKTYEAAENHAKTQAYKEGFDLVIRIAVFDRLVAAKYLAQAN